MTNPVSRPRWSDPEVVPLSRSTVEQELAVLKRQHQDLQTRHAQLAAALAQLSKQYGATQPLPAAQPPAVSSFAPIPQTESRERSDLSFLSELRQRQAPQPLPQPMPMPQVAQLPINPAPAAPAPPQPYPVQSLQPPQAKQPPTPQWQQESPKAWQEPQWHQNQPPKPTTPPPQPTWNSAPSWGQPEADNYAEDQQSQYDSLYEKVRHQQDDQSTPMWMWLVAAMVLLTVSFGTGFLMVRHFIGRSAPPPPVESAS